jgi:hypothetical protein
MPSTSKKQQRFMGMVHSCKKTGKCASKEVAKVAKNMKSKDVKDFATTKHDKLPEKIKKIKTEDIMNKEKKLMVEFINTICDKDYSKARRVLEDVVENKLKAKIKEIASSDSE